MRSSIQIESSCLVIYNESPLIINIANLIFDFLKLCQSQTRQTVICLNALMI